MCEKGTLINPYFDTLSISFIKSVTFIFLFTYTACSPILGTTVTINRLKQRGYMPFEDFYCKVSVVRFTP